MKAKACKKGTMRVGNRCIPIHKKEQRTILVDLPKAGELKPFTTKADRDRLVRERLAEKEAEEKSLYYKPTDFKIIKNTGDPRIPYRFISKDGEVDVNVFWVKDRYTEISGSVGNDKITLISPLPRYESRVPDSYVFLRSLTIQMKEDKIKKSTKEEKIPRNVAQYFVEGVVVSEAKVLKRLDALEKSRFGYNKPVNLYSVLISRDAACNVSGMFNNRMVSRSKMQIPGERRFNLFFLFALCNNFLPDFLSL